MTHTSFRYLKFLVAQVRTRLQICLILSSGQMCRILVRDATGKYVSLPVTSFLLV